MWVLGLACMLAGCSTNPARTADEPASHGPRYAQDGNIGARSALAVARRQVGKRYRYGGATPEGFDCSGLVYYAYRQAGIPVPRTTKALFGSARPVRLSELQPGDLLFFKVSSYSVSHVAIYAGNGSFIHAPSSGKRVSAASMDSPYWRERLVRAGRIH